MARLKILGSSQYLKVVLAKYNVPVRGGHTVIEYDIEAAEAVAQAEAIFRALTGPQLRFTALDTSTTYPSRVTEFDATKPDVEYSLIPAIAGGVV